MTPFRRGKFWSLYIPRQSGGVVQRACGTTDARLAKAMGRMVDTLADSRRWEILEAIDAGRVSVGEVYDAYAMNRLDALMARVAAVGLADYRERFLESLAVAPRTAAAYRQKLEALVQDAMTSDEITAGWVTDTLAALPHSSGTKKQYLHVLSLFLDYLVGHRVLTLNPIHQRGLVRRMKNNAPRRVWKQADEDERLVRSAPVPFRHYFALVHGSGAERDAALAMRRRDVDLVKWELHIPGTKNRYRDRRGVPLEAWARPYVAELCRGLLPDAPLFGGLNSRAVNAAHLAARTAAGLAGYELRDARHSYACRALIRGEPLWKVSKWLGHSDVATTARVYTQFDLPEALAALGRMSVATGTHGASGTTSHTT